MKLIITFLALISVTGVMAQDKWYYDKYEVKDLSELTPGQYAIALKDAKDLALGMAIWTGAGVGIYFVGRHTVRKGLDEDASFWAELFGNEIVGYSTMGIGIASVGVGIIGTGVGLSRVRMLKKSASDKSGAAATVVISPVVITDRYSSNVAPGASITIRF